MPPVSVHAANVSTWTANSGDTDGAAFTLPSVTARKSALIGGSNFTADADFEGSLRYIRVYDETFTAAEAAENAGVASASSSSNDTASPSDDSGEPGFFIAVMGRPDREFEGSEVVYGAYAVAADSIYQVTLQSITHPTVFNRVLATGRTSNGGHLVRTLNLPAAEAGSYRITLVGVSSAGARLKLTNHVNVDEAGKFTSVSTEAVQPLLN